jgi:hypothetical protein
LMNREIVSIGLFYTRKGNIAREFSWIIPERVLLVVLIQNYTRKGIK